MDDSTKPPRLVLLGASGRMGRAISYRFLTDEKIQLVGAVDTASIGETLGSLVGSSNDGPKIVASPDNLASNLQADSALDFSTSSAVRANIEPCLKRGWDYIVGATGFTDEDETEFARLAEAYKKRVVLVPNFTIGMSLLLKIAREAARVFRHVEIIELHHDKKADAPSGTATYTARLVGRERNFIEPPSPDFPSRGEVIDGVPVHSIRMQGFIAHQEIIFGGLGETLSIRHDTTDRSAFLAGIYLAVEKIGRLAPGLTVGLDWIFED
jgi:4-hydroxy-tetrahydrodipicolinate reductase